MKSHPTAALSPFFVIALALLVLGCDHGQTAKETASDPSIVEDQPDEKETAAVNSDPEKNSHAENLDPRAGNPKSMYSEHAFRDAAFNGKMSVIQSVLESNMDVNAVDENGQTAFAMAAHGGHMEIVKLLIKHGAEIDRPDAVGITPLAMAAFNGHTEIVKLLIEKGADVNAADVQGNTPIVHASGGTVPETVQVLIDAEADIDVRFGDEKWTPLMMAAAEGSLECAKVLLKAGANQSVKDTDGETALDFAKEKGHTELIELLSP